jgi:hypothetical protein
MRFEAATFQFGAQCLNQLHHRVLLSWTVCSSKSRHNCSKWVVWIVTKFQCLVPVLTNHSGVRERFKIRVNPRNSHFHSVQKLWPPILYIKCSELLCCRTLKLWKPQQIHSSTIYLLYYLAHICSGIFSFLRELTRIFHYNIQQYIICKKHTFVFMLLVFGVC